MELIDAAQAAPRWQEALVRMQEALVILDEANAPLEIGNHLDLAVSRLEEVLHGKPSPAASNRLRDEIERLLDAD
jgi:ATP:corrinoid adenosyltransferase